MGVASMLGFFIIPDLYRPTGEMLGNGSYASVQTYKNNHSNKEYAVKVIIDWFIILRIW